MFFSWFAYILALWLFAICCSCNDPIESEDDYIIPWGVNTMKGIMRGQSLRVIKIRNPHNSFHTCYEVWCEGLHCPADDSAKIKFCYPAIIVTGLPKCGTSAMYDLLTRYTGAMVMHEKENCPYARRRTHWQFFNSLARYSDTTDGKLSVDGCIDLKSNILMKNILRNPRTIYIVMVRNYADMVWSSYNFWCKREYDKQQCDSTRWVVPSVHTRSPEIFHAIIMGDKLNSPIDSPIHIKRPCAFAGGYYAEFMQLELWAQVPRNMTMVVASEELSDDPSKVWNKVANKLKLSSSELVLGNFTQVRINAQENKGASHSTPLSQYKPGLFAVSKYQPMSDATRAVLDKCWHEDCITISQYSGYQYPSCFNETRELIRSGDWKSFREIFY